MRPLPHFFPLISAVSPPPFVCFLLFGSRWARRHTSLIMKDAGWVLSHCSSYLGGRVVRLHSCSVLGFYPWAACLGQSICANRRAASSYYGLAFYGRRHTLSILSFESHRVLISFSPSQGLTCPVQNRYSRCNRARVYALPWESLPHRRIQYLPSPGLPHQCLYRPSRSQPYHRHDPSRYYDLQNQHRKPISRRRRSLLWLSPFVWSSGCWLAP